MRKFYIGLFCLLCSGGIRPLMAQPYFQATATINGNNIEYKIKAVDGDITCGWGVIEFFFRNTTVSPVADGAFSGATITVNTANFPGVSIPYNGMNFQGTETGYNNYWFGTFFFPPTAAQTYLQNQEYLLCTIGLSTPPSTYNLELCHNEPYFFPDYMTLTDDLGNEQSSPSGICKFYGPGAGICQPGNCPVSTPGNNHIMALNGSAPVELIDFQAFKQDEHTALLVWQTASETGSDHFEVERKHAGAWLQIGEENARSEAGDRYSVFDRMAPPGEVYYRLRMVDLDGSYAFSAVRRLRFQGGEPLRLFPNPVTDILYLEPGPGFPEETLQVELFDWSGRAVLRASLEGEAGGAVLALPLGAHDLPAGVYSLHAGSERGFSFARKVAIGNP